MMYGSGYGLGSIINLLWLILIVALVVYGVRWFARDGGRALGNKGALDILNERYAKGEIDKEEYEEKKKVLQG